MEEYLGRQRTSYVSATEHAEPIYRQHKDCTALHIPHQVNPVTYDKLKSLLKFNIHLRVIRTEEKDAISIQVQQCSLVNGVISSISSRAASLQHRNTNTDRLLCQCTQSCFDITWSDSNWLKNVICGYGGIADVG